MNDPQDLIENTESEFDSDFEYDNYEDPATYVPEDPYFD